MRIYDLIAKKRDGGTHSREELEAIVNGFVSGEVADYQMAAWMMAVYLRGMTDEEMKQPIIGVVSAYSEIIPGHINLDKIADAVKAGIGYLSEDRKRSLESGMDAHLPKPLDVHRLQSLIEKVVH